MTSADSKSHRLVVHGLAVELTCGVDALLPQFLRTFESFLTPSFPEGFVPIVGQIRPYDAGEVSRSLSPSAVELQLGDQLLEVYEEGEHFWILDDRWGMTQLNMLRGQFRSWILPHPTVDSVRCLDGAFFWPLAQLMRGKGLHLIPGVSVARGDWGALILTPYGIEPELRVLVEAGYKIIGQRWTAIREEAGKFSLLHVPGQVECAHEPRMRIAGAGASERWVDLGGAYPDSIRHHAYCENILVVVPGRRTRARLQELTPILAGATLKRDWPMAELHPHRRGGQLAGRLANRCRVAEVHLSRRADDFIVLMDSIRPIGSVFHDSAISLSSSPQSLAG
ncbi:MAG: hypothetical protein IT447_01580 [Phycisphaerales bacterium]|nr:hypothetical protein [Phycisphaerales bacterium]